MNSLFLKQDNLGRAARSLHPRAFIIFVFVLLFLACSFSPAQAVPQLFKKKQEPPVKVGPSLSQRLASGKFAPSLSMLAPASYPYTANILFLKIDFPPDTDTTTTGTGEWSDPAYSTGVAGGVADYWLNQDETTFKSYYSEVSGGKLTINVVRSSLYRMPKSMRSYGDESYVALESLIYDAVDAALNSTTTPTISTAQFATYDAVLIVHAGAGEETDMNSDTTFDIWSLYYSNPDGIAKDGLATYSGGVCTNCLDVVLKNGKPISEAILMPQTDSQDNVVVDPVGVYVHEFGHWLGLPDLYCTNGYLCSIDGVGEWSLMGDGMYNGTPYGSKPAHPDAWCKKFLGWVTVATPPNPEGATGFTISSLVTTPTQTVYMLPAVHPSSTDATASQQYYLIENRQLTGFDSALPGKGLLVWLVDESVIGTTTCTTTSTSNYCMNTINNSSFRPGVRLIEADNDNALMKYGCSANLGIDCGSAGDPFPGSKVKSVFSPITTPSSQAYTAPAWVNLRNITESLGVISLDIGFGPHAPVVYPGAMGAFTWNAYTSEADPAVNFNVYKNTTAAPVVAKTASLTYSDNTALSTDVYLVSGLDAQGNESAFGGIWPVLTLSTSYFGFSAAGVTNTLTVSNDATANASLSVSAMTVTGTNMTDFKVIADNCTGVVLSPGSNCTAVVQFLPTVAGTKSATLDITSNDPNRPKAQVLLSGTMSAGGISSSGGPCFIATAAYGSYLDPHVQVLRDFRDRHLLTNGPGRVFVAFYYRHSPPIADFIRDHAVPRYATRTALTPIILAIEYPMIVMFGLCCFLIVTIRYTGRRRSADRN